MRRWRVTLVTVVCCLLIAGTVAGADDAGPIDPKARYDEIVALVLAQDARFADLPDYEFQSKLARSNFDTVGMLLGESYYRVLPTQATTYSPWWVDFGYAGNWLVEVNLVEGCEEPAGDTPPIPDPCAWRHSWFYRVEPDDSVTLLFEEGHPEPAPSA